MAIAAASAHEEEAPAITGDLRPYAPSWADRLMDLLRRAPGPTWLAYLVLLGVSQGISAVEGMVSREGTFDLLLFFYAYLPVTALAVMHYLDHIAGEAWDGFRPVTNLAPAAAERVRFELTVCPARPAWALLALGYLANTAWYLTGPGSVDFVDQPLAYVALRAVVEGFVGGILFVLVFQVVRQLRIINRLHASAANIDLFRPRAIQSLSRLTARSAIGIVLIAVMVGLPLPGVPDQTWLAIIGVFVAPMLALALVVFILPLRRLHDRLVDEKSEMLAATVLRLRATIDALHRLVDTESGRGDDPGRSGDAQARIDALSKAQAALIQQRDMIVRLSTWPWDAATFRAVASAVALPVLIFVITRYLDRVLV